MNDDGFHVNIPDAPKNAEAFLKYRTSALAGSQVDAIFYCTGVFNYYTHHSEISEIIKVNGHNKPLWTWELKNIEGRDSLEIMVNFSREHDMEIFWSMRMNDTHDYAYPPLMCQWKKDHYEYMMGWNECKPSAVNYEIPQVRRKVFDILQDVCTRYDVDGIELDFFRHPSFFKISSAGQATQEQCDLMTDLLRQVRQMTEKTAAKRGKPMLIAVRVPDSAGYAKAIGLDLQRWLEDDLVDILVGSGYFQLEPWENFVAMGAKFNTPVYPCLSTSRLVDAAYPEKPADVEVMRGEALRAWQAGVSGIYTFNRVDPEDPIFRELGDPDLLATLPHKYTFNPGLKAHMDNWCPNGSRFLIPDERKLTCR